MTTLDVPGAAPRGAATVILLRPMPGGPPEILLLRRHARSGFAARAWVFPGGVLDEADRGLGARCWEGIDPVAAAVVLGKAPDVALGLHVAAVRETFEEAGVLLARRGGGEPVDLHDPAVLAMRRAVADRGQRTDFHGWLADAGLVLDLRALTAYRRWLTPVQEPRRYDAIFFLARAPLGQVADHDRVETTESRWITAGDALKGYRRRDLHLIYPTVKTLESLARFDDVDALLASVDRTVPLRPLQPHMVLDAEGRITGILHPDDPAYPWELYPELAS